MENDDNEKIGKNQKFHVRACHEFFSCVSMDINKAFIENGFHFLVDEAGGDLYVPKTIFNFVSSGCQLKAATERPFQPPKELLHVETYYWSRRIAAGFFTAPRHLRQPRRA
ncbi:hypothetical protein [Geothermobacter hydrogeniphilus]|uniref:hypothetical protein n=1 Tax=Geothermobacter hydrogeniphilus TaxID=1969733 RepID=UPI00111C3DFF|nr:hypothetical protein [Geothermobacter hydrogeniphilus]